MFKFLQKQDNGFGKAHVNGEYHELRARLPNLLGKNSEVSESMFDISRRLKQAASVVARYGLYVNSLHILKYKS